MLFTACLVAQVPHDVAYISTWRSRDFPIAGRSWTQNYLAPMGFASLACVLIALIVLWAGYRKGARWAWFAMFVVVWIFTFPVYVLPVILQIPQAGSIDWPGILIRAIERPGLEREVAKGPLNFIAMLIALLVPVPWFFGKRCDSTP
jgi:hypothetical protein